MAMPAALHCKLVCCIGFHGIRCQAIDCKIGLGGVTREDGGYRCLTSSSSPNVCASGSAVQFLVCSPSDCLPRGGPRPAFYARAPFHPSILDRAAFHPPYSIATLNPWDTCCWMLSFPVQPHSLMDVSCLVLGDRWMGGPGPPSCPSSIPNPVRIFGGTSAARVALFRRTFSLLGGARIGLGRDGRGGEEAGHCQEHPRHP